MNDRVDFRTFARRYNGDIVKSLTTLSILISIGCLKNAILLLLAGGPVSPIELFIAVLLALLLPFLLSRIIAGILLGISVLYVIYFVVSHSFNGIITAILSLLCLLTICSLRAHYKVYLRTGEVES